MVASRFYCFPPTAPSGGYVAIASKDIGGELMSHSFQIIAGAILSRFAVCYLGTPQTPNARQGLHKLRRAIFLWKRAHFLICPPCPMPSLRPRSLRHCCVLSGVFSRAFFFLCSFSFVCSSRFCSLPSCGWSGVGSWLLFLAAAFVGAFFFWVCLLVRFCFSFSRCCLCLRGVAFGRLCGLGSSWLVFCWRVCLVCLRACCALSCSWGFVPLFLCDESDRSILKNERLKR